ncbi:hypothetical protein SAMN05661012_01122 [Chitinophaga sancti]|uniref:Uncharacterized protein n=1 Tax=Chitinophaga sancti TaxID=1004 RepID=A0A1K1NB08_9BACT|nr:hypothetical protein SAMN05661012_01122 [Chitinophaga sancti]
MGIAKSNGRVMKNKDWGGGEFEGMFVIMRPGGEFEWWNQ